MAMHGMFGKVKVGSAKAIESTAPDELPLTRGADHQFVITTGEWR